MPFSFSWVELHGALTHFPITLLILAGAFDLGSLLWRKAAWRDTSLWLLWIAVIMCPFALLSGYLTGREYARPPIGFQTHWIVAVVTSILALALLLWRVLSRDELASRVRMAALALTGVCALTVSYTGYLGGQMVFGSDAAPADASPATASPTAAAVPNAPGSDKLAAAAGKMEAASLKLQAATDKFAASAGGRRPQSSTPVAASSPAAVASAPAVSASAMDTQKLDQAAARLNSAADRFDKIADKLTRLSERTPEQQASPNAPARPRAPERTANPPAPSSAPPSTPAASSGLNASLISTGEALFRSDDNGCLSCHVMNGEGHAKGPDLTHEAQRHGDPGWQIEHLKDPQKMVPGSKMPPYDDLKPDALQALGAYLASRK